MNGTETNSELKTELIFEETGNQKSPWLLPLLLLLALSMAIFIFGYFIDFLLYKIGSNFFRELYTTDISNLTNTVGGLGEIVSAILGIEITVLAIIVQLAANKYSDKIMELFVEDRVNFFVIGFFVITAVDTVLVINFLKTDFVTFFSLTLVLVMIIVSLLIVIPHFNYVFNFLRPNNFLGYVKKTTIKVIDDIASGKLKYSLKQRNKVHENINFLGDIALNGVIQGDRAVTLLCVGILREVTLHYIEKKKELPEDWFRLSGYEFYDPDFSSYSQFVMKRIEERKILLERKIFRLYEMLFDNSRAALRDVASGVLLNSELIASGAVQAKDDGALQCAFQYFNSYLRIGIRAKDPRSAFNTLEHYRILAEELLEHQPEQVEKVSFYFKYYGQEANKNNILFILETASFDLCKVNEIAFEKKVPNLRKLLDLFLTLDQPIDAAPGKDTAGEQSLIGVRIAQSRLAGYYLLRGETELARLIFEDMRIEPMHRIQKIKELIFNTEDAEFWEITPRGINFYYVSPERRYALLEFFGWFEKVDDLREES